MSINGTLVEDKMRRFEGECAYFSSNTCLIYTHDGASAKFSTNSHETDNSVGLLRPTEVGGFVAYAALMPPTGWMSALYCLLVSLSL